MLAVRLSLHTARAAYEHEMQWRRDRGCVGNHMARGMRGRNDALDGSVA